MWATKPSFKYDSEFDGYVGTSKYIEAWYFPFISIFGAIIALSRLRDRLLRYKVHYIWLGLSCQSHRKKPFHHFDKLVEKAQLNAFLKTSLNTELVITILKGI